MEIALSEEKKNTSAEFHSHIIYFWDIEDRPFLFYYVVDFVYEKWSYDRLS